MLEKWKNSVLKNYLTHHNPPMEEVNHILDYLERSGDKITLRISYPQAKIKADDWTKRLNKKVKNSKGECELVFTTAKGLNLFHLKDQEALNWEGSQMSHCVASYKNHPGIFSLRKGEESIATIEINNGKIIQVRGKENKKLSKENSTEALEALNFLQLDITEEEAFNLGFVELSPDEVLNLMEHSEKPLIYPLKDKDYLSLHHELKITNYSFFNNKKFFNIFAMQGNNLGVEFILKTNLIREPKFEKFLYSQLLILKQYDMVFTLLRYEKWEHMWSLIIRYFILSEDTQNTLRGYKELSFEKSKLGFNALNLSIEARSVKMVRFILQESLDQIDKHTQSYLDRANSSEITRLVEGFKILQIKPQFKTF